MSIKPVFVISMAALALATTLGSGRAQTEPNKDDAATFGPAGGAAVQVNVDTAFTYQGRLTSSGAPVNGICDFQFGLWDAASGGTQIGSTQTKTNVNVTAGYFTIPDLNFGNAAFDGQARWLEIAVRCPAGGSGSYTGLSPRQALRAAPYAHSLRPGALVIGVPPFEYIVYARNTSMSNLNASGFWGVSDSANGGRGVTGHAAATSGTTYGVVGQSDSTAGTGVYGSASATSGTTYGMYGRSDSTAGTGVYGVHWASSGTAPGVHGATNSTSDYAVGVLGVVNSSTPGYLSAAVRGQNNGTDTNGIGVWGSQAGSGWGVYGEAQSDGYGVVGYVPTGGSGYAGYFVGNVYIAGNFNAGGVKSFVIDHPLDPANKYLYHFAQEGPMVQNVYNGVVTLDAAGEATVTLPNYFAAANAGPFLYQLTPVGAAMPNLHVAQEINDNQFKIAGGVPGKRVSWEVTATRNDPVIRTLNPQAEVEKPAGEKGTYLHPEAFGQPAEKGRDYQRNAALREADEQTGGDK